MTIFKMADKLKCVTCGIETDIPRCCNIPMEIMNEILRCKICGDRNEMFIHCGKKMKK
jgi:transcription elongation factor Elf1